MFVPSSSSQDMEASLPAIDVTVVSPKEQDDPSFDRDGKKFSSMVLTLFCWTVPLAVADVFFALLPSQESCMKNAPLIYLYLVGHAYFTVGAKWLAICGQLCAWNWTSSSPCEDKMLQATGWFVLVWNVMGSAVFLGSVCPSAECGNPVQIYLAVTLPMKLLESAATSLRPHNCHRH